MLFRSPAALLSFLSIHLSIRPSASSSHVAAGAPEPTAPASTNSKPHRAPALCSLLLLVSPSSFFSLLTPSLFSLLQDLKLPWMLHRAQVKQSKLGSAALLNPVQIQAVPIGSTLPRRKSLESRRCTSSSVREPALERRAVAHQDALPPKPPPLARTLRSLR